ncbi:MAG: 1-(5-phosphoribosyl)-5-[(5-phosphoribosylamino)methylideneamino] imidazole-4-carboxamide isomerase [Thermoplasmatales archaeon]|nr:1-(5-phosphoribosyl)-5-[(5-phosphoribosylamino)methylideneamino] imidazole-4-carboxamide isomerase [Thermoplasmatales archaeon]
MFVIPSIDILNGKCVQLVNGKIETATIYGSPKEYYKKWIEKGADKIHVIDLDAAFNLGSNKTIILDLLEKREVEIQVGGGIRDVAYASELIDSGAKRIIIGSKLQDSSFLKNLLKKIPKEQIMIALDTSNGKIVTSAWQNDTGIKYEEGVKRIKKFAGSILSTDVSREGLLEGPNSIMLKKIVQEKIPVYASGGFTTIEDIKLAKNLGFSGVIIGRALYTKKIDLGELF